MRAIVRIGINIAVALSLTVPIWAEQVPLPLQWVERPEMGEGVESLGLDEQLWGTRQTPGDQQALLTAIDYSLTYLESSEAATAYAQYSVPGITRDRVRRSLERFRELVVTSESPVDLQTSVLQEFELYQSIGADGNGTVSFTGYFQPTYLASRTPTDEFRYPLYRLPPELDRWSRPHPTRAELEGLDGLQGSQGRLQGLELVWLPDRLEAYLVHVQGSAQLELTDSSTMAIGYAGRTDYPYVSLGRELVNDGKFRLEDLSLPVVIQYFRDHPAALDRYIPRNNRFVFFEETTRLSAIGSLGIPVTAARSIATDKSLMPPGALALIQTQIPYPNANGDLIPQFVSRYVLDQDTGGAIRGAGRVDIFMGTGDAAGDQAGRINHSGQLYYLLLNE